MIIQTVDMKKRELVTARNESIIKRYSELYFVQLMREDEIYNILEKEFYLKRRTLYGIILDNSKAPIN